MTLSNVTSGLADSCATITARRPECLTWQGRAVCPLVSAVLARGLRAEIPRFFCVAENVAVKMLLFFWELVAMDIFTLRER